MRFRIFRSSGASCDDVPGATITEQSKERIYLYDAHWMPNRESFEAHNPHTPVIREYEENGGRGVIYREDTSFWTKEIPDLSALIWFGRVVGHALILDAIESSIEIYDADREE